jgi:RED-like protein N-terminal region
MWKLDQIDRATFEKLRDEIVGGDISSTHLVKGLDYKLLERVRRGEDVLNKGPAAEEEESAAECAVDEELEKLEDKEIVPISKQKAVKRGEMAPPPGPGAVAGRKRTRDEILAELKASRQAAKATQEPTLGPKFRKIGEPKEKTRIERDEKGREVLITIDKDGRVKKKVRKSIVEQSPKGSKDGLLMPEKGAKPLGMEVPDFAAKSPAEEPEDIDIFEGVGADYDPFAGLGDGGDDDSSSEESEDIESSRTKPPVQEIDNKDDESRSPHVEALSSESEIPPPAAKQPSTAPRNYFSTPTVSHEPSVSDSAPLNPLTDPTILAALRKASTIDPLRPSAIHDPEAAAREARRRKLLDTHDRDAEDMDLGFGSSRFEDEEDMEEKKVKLSAWGGGDGKEGRGEGKSKRKRGPKKRKGDGNSAADVMKVIERQKKEGK